MATLTILDAENNVELQIIAQSVFKGDNAYSVALNNGFIGTEAQWLASLAAGTGDQQMLAVINKLSEFNTEQAKSDARANLGVAVVDGGTF